MTETLPQSPDPEDPQTAPCVVNQLYPGTLCYQEHSLADISEEADSFSLWAGAVKLEQPLQAGLLSRGNVVLIELEGGRTGTAMVMAPLDSSGRPVETSDPGSPCDLFAVVGITQLAAPAVVC